MFTDRTRPIRAAIISALAGGATLCGEALGSRLLRPVVGSTSAAEAGAVAGVLGGIGIGALVAGARIEQRPERARATLQFALVTAAALSAVAPFIARALPGYSAPVLVALAARAPHFADFVRAVLALVLTLPFGTLAGACYPALAELHGRSAGRATAVTGAASSLGAGVLSLLATFALAPALGVTVSLRALVVLDAVAFVSTFTFPSGAPDDTAPLPTRTARGASRVPAALVAVGVASVVWQLALTRVAVLAFGASAFALTATTAAYVIALGLGEATAAAWVDRVSNATRALAIALGVGTAGAVAMTRVAAQLPAWSAVTFHSGAPTMPHLWSRAIALLVVVMIPVVVPIAAGMALAARALGESGHTRSSANARTLAAMALGNVLGALVGPLVAVPQLELSGALVASGGLLGLAAVAVVFGSPTRRGALVLAASAATFALGSRAAVRGWDATSLSRGPFLYTGAEDLDLGRIVRIGYGSEATVAVRRDDTGEVLLQIDGKIDATSGGDNATQTLVSVFPAVLSAHPRNVLVIGLGSGMSVDAVRDVPGVAHVDVTELLPEVIEAARREFRAANHAVLEAPNVRMLHADASLFLRGTRWRYDVIVSEPSNPWVAGMADLFTTEALEAARARLAPGGVMSAWFHGYSTDVATFAGILATFRGVFPHAALVEMVAGQDYMMLGMLEPVTVDVDRVSALLGDTGVHAQLAHAGIADRGEFFGRFIAGVDGLEAMTRDAEPFGAGDLRLEFRAPALLYSDASDGIFALIARAQDQPLAGLSPVGHSYELAVEESEPTREAGLHARQMSAAMRARRIDQAISEGELAVAASPQDLSIRTDLAHAYLRRAGRRYRAHDPGGAADDLRNTLELRPGLAEQFRAHVVLGDLALAREAFAPAASEYGLALDIARATQSPTPELHIRMAQVLVALGDVPHARAELDRAARECSDPARLRDIDDARGRLERR